MARIGAFKLAVFLLWIVCVDIDAAIAWSTRSNAAFATTARYRATKCKARVDTSQYAEGLEGEARIVTRRVLMDRYAQARDIRTQQGHEAALPYYQELLTDNPDDRTAGSRIAASPETPMRHDLACDGAFYHDDYNANNKNGRESTNIDLMKAQPKILQLQAILRSHAYDHAHISEFFGVPNVLDQPNSGVTCAGPLFCSPVAPGSVALSNYPFGSNGAQRPSALACLVGLFLLGLAVPKAWLVEALGTSSCELLQELGLIFPCSVDASLYLAYVHIFPMDFLGGSNALRKNSRTTTSTLWLVTDLHPKVLSTISVGTHGEDSGGNSVMYIGPDSLALAQHFKPYEYLEQQFTFDITKGDTPPRALDLCTGSGVQALVAMMHWNLTAAPGTNIETGVPVAPLYVTAVDVNPRALRFARFNALLNGFHDQLDMIEADLITGKCRGTDRSLEDLLAHPLHLMLANPPFLPVPMMREETTSNDENSPQQTTYLGVQATIQKRYGLFSAGGASGEVVLQRIVELASRSLAPGGMLGVVSEFFLVESDEHFDRISSWWTSAAAPGNDTMAAGRGLLFLNEFPITAETYAERRGDTPDETALWWQHLQRLNITQASPGLLYAQRLSADEGRDIESPCFNIAVKRVPKTDGGSIWTPSNTEAISFTQATTKRWLLPLHESPAD